MMVTRGWGGWVEGTGWIFKYTNWQGLGYTRPRFQMHSAVNMDNSTVLQLSKLLRDWNLNISPTKNK